MIIDVYIHALFVEVLIVLLKNDSTLNLNLRKCRGRKKLRKNFHPLFQLRDMRTEPVLRVFPKSGGTKVPADIFEFHIQGNRVGVLPVSPKEHMFQKMGDAVVLLIFKSQPGPDKHRHFRGVNMRHFHRHHRQAVGQDICKIF